MNVVIQWKTEKRFPRPGRSLLKKLLQRTAELAGAGIRENETLSITFLSSEKMKEVNGIFLSHQGDTDVICFDYRQAEEKLPDMLPEGEDRQFQTSQYATEENIPETNSVLENEDKNHCDEDCTAVDILVCPAVAEREAAKRGLPYSRELILYAAHGLLHAAGYDDLKPELKRKMRAAERRVLSALEKEFHFQSIIRPPADSAVVLKEKRSQK